MHVTISAQCIAGRVLFGPHSYVSLCSAHELKQQLGLGGTFSWPVPDMILQQLRAFEALAVVELEQLKRRAD